MAAGARLLNSRQAPAATAPTTPEPDPSDVTLLLTNGGAITGTLASETPDEVILTVDGGDISFARGEIMRIHRGRVTNEGGIILPTAVTAARTWAHAHSPVLRLINGSILDAAVVRLENDLIHLRQPAQGGGSIEMAVPRQQLDYLLFKPITAERSLTIRNRLQQTFPTMQWYDEGMFSILTDSPKPTVGGYWRVLHEAAADWYFTFLPLLDGRAPQIQQHLVIFDDWEDYIEYALTDGVPGWQMVGYFNPEDESLYLFNMLGERFSEMLYASFLGAARQQVDSVVKWSTSASDKRQEIFLDGLGVEVKAKFEAADTVLRAGYRAITEQTLRHELTHGLFYNWGLQTVVTSRIAEDQEDLAAMKQKFLSSDDFEGKSQLLKELLNPTLRQPVETGASNSWVVEGLGAYMETPPGQPNDARLSDLQRAAAEGTLMPIEFLNAFRMGSFAGAATEAALQAYAHSWGLVYFLMDRHPDAFMKFLLRIAEQPDVHGEELAWLEELTGVPPRELERQFADYVRRLPTRDAPWLAQYDAFLDIFDLF